MTREKYTSISRVVNISKDLEKCETFSEKVEHWCVNEFLREDLEHLLKCPYLDLTTIKVISTQVKMNSIFT